MGLCFQIDVLELYCFDYEINGSTIPSLIFIRLNISFLRSWATQLSFVVYLATL